MSTTNEKKTLRESYTIIHDTATKSWEETIFLNFNPDIMILKAISYVGTGADVGAISIWTNLLRDGDGYIGSFIADSTTNPKSVFKLGYQINGRYKFALHSAKGVLNTTATSLLAVQLEFIKFE